MDGSKIYLRPVNIQDCELLYQWRNEEDVRRNSFSTEPVRYEEHQEWLRHVLQEETVLFYIMVCKGKELGQVRIDTKNEVGIINYSIDVLYRCKGYGKVMMQILETEIKKADMDIGLIAYVKKDNVASQKIFEDLDYVRQDEQDCFCYIKNRLGMYDFETDFTRC